MKQLALINAQTQVCTTIANPNRATISPIMHNAGFAELDLNFVYLAFEPTDLAGAVSAIRALGIRGSSVSKPFKIDIMQYLDKIDPIAERIGAVNTVDNDNGTLVGYNSDWIGAVNALREVTNLDGKSVALIGAGGAGRAIAFGLLDAKSDVTIFNRTQRRGEELAAQTGAKWGGTAFEDAGGFDILVNATSVGTGDSVGQLPLAAAALAEHLIVLDAVFNPAMTPLLEAASKAGCNVINGLHMLVHQGAFQFNLFTGRDAPIGVMEQAAKAALA